MSFLAGDVNYNFACNWLPNGVVFVEGKNTTLIDSERKKWLDFYCNFGSNIFGHGNTEYSKYVKQALDSLSSVSMSEYAIKAAEKINQYMPSMELLRFTTAGTLAVDSAIRLARAYTQKTKVLRFVNHYHGHSDYLLGGTFDGRHSYPVDFEGDARASLGAMKEERTKHTCIIYCNDEKLLKKTFIEKGNELACVIMEPLNLNGGGIEIDQKYLMLLVELCNEYNVLLIFDEIITGVRVGLGGVQKKLDISPDLTVLGKAIAGGAFPVAAVGGKKKIMNLLVENKVVQAGTFNGYTIGCAAVLATYSIIEQDNFYKLKNMYKNGAKIRRFLEEKSQEYGVELKTQGHDSAFCIHAKKEKISSAQEWSAEIQRKEELLQRLFFEEGILTATKLRFYLNLDITEEELNEFYRRTEKVIKVYSETLHKEKRYE